MIKSQVYSANLIKPIFATDREINRIRAEIGQGSLNVLDERIESFTEKTSSYFKKEQGIECALKYTELMRSAYQIEPSKNPEVSRVINLWRSCGVYKNEFQGDELIYFTKKEKKFGVDTFLFNSLTMVN